MAQQDPNEHERRMAWLGEHAPPEALADLKALAKRMHEEFPDMTEDEFADLVLGEDEDE